MQRQAIAILVLAACGASSPAPASSAHEGALPCAGQTLVRERPIPELGPLPSGEPVTAGVALTCAADHLDVLDWGPDSSAAYTIPREHAMEAWDAFERATTEDERRLIVGRYTTAAPAVAVETAPPTTPTLQLLGVERSRLLFLDVARTPWVLETIDVAPISDVHDAVFLGCGDRAAGRGAREVAVHDRSGALVGRAPLPSLVPTLGARLDIVVAALAEEYGVSADAETIAAMIGVGPLVRTRDGHLAMDPVLDESVLYGELEGCRSPREDLRVELALSGVEPAPCDAIALTELPLGREPVEPPAGWTCGFVSAEDRAAPPWLTDASAVVRGATSGDDLECGSDATDAWERFAECQPDSPGLGVCRAPDATTIIAAVVPGDVMGCAAGPDLFVVRGTSVRARGGSDGHAYVAGDVWIYGGRRRWFVDAATREEPLAFGRARPDAVLGARLQ